ncbi:MAG: hypothetical protein QG610_1868, partial [Euryarchaeota archaeon]|nr:hypothetical protein [Euryarchaeota archaeon]
CTIVNEMHYLRNAHDKYYGKEIYKYSTRIILNVDQLKTLEDVVSKKLKDKAENRDLDIHPNIAYILKRWKLLGAKEEEINNVISRIIQNEDKLINFISSCMFVPRNNCIFENKIEFDISLVEEFMNLEEVESSMKKFDFSGDLWGMNEREKLIVKHFLVNVENAKKSNEKPLIGTIKQEHF